MKMQAGTGRRISARLAFGFLLLFVSLPVAAQVGLITPQSLFFNQASSGHQGNYVDAQAGLLYSDNLTLSPGGSGGGIAMIGLAADTQRQNAPTLDYHLDCDINLLRYLNSAYQTQPSGYLDGLGEFKIVPGVFSWTARDTYTQMVLDYLEPPTPDNLESINNFTTGPRLTLRPTLQTTITLDGTYSYVATDSKSPEYVNIDNQRLGGDVRISHTFSSTLNAYLSGNYEDVRFKDTVDNQDFTYLEGMTGVAWGDARTSFNASVGYTVARLEAATPTAVPHLHLDPLLTASALNPALVATDIEPVMLAAATEGGSSASTSNPGGVTWQVSLSRLISPTQRVSLHALSEVTDAANLFRLNLDQPVPSSGQNLLGNGQPFEYREYGATWTFATGRTTITANLVADSSHYTDTPTEDYSTKQASVLVARQLNPSMNWDLGVSYQHNDYQLGVVHSINAITNLRWQLGHKVTLRFVYVHSSQGPNGYSENEIGVIASYSLVGSAALAPVSAGALNGDGGLQPLSPASQPWLH